MKATPAKLLIVITVIIFLFTQFADTTTRYHSNLLDPQYCCPVDVNDYYGFCDCEYNVCCKYTYTDYNFALIPYAVFEKPWTLVTVMFLHMDWWHILLNMIGLILFGIYLEKVVGWKNFLLIYFIGGVIASVIYIPFAIYLGDTYTPMVGASGAIYAVIIALMIIRPYDTIFKLRERGVFYDVFRAFPLWFEGYMPIFIVGMIYLVVALSGVFVDFLMGMQSGVANAAHVGGAIAGIIFGFYFRKFYAKDRNDRDVERRHTPLDRRQKETARIKGARLVRRNIFGRYEYVDTDTDKEKEKHEDKLEIEDEKQKEPEKKRQIKPGEKGLDDELEIID